MLKAFTAHMDTPDAPEAFYALVSSKLNLTKNSCYVISVLLADLLLLYRTYVVWGRNYLVVIIPFLILAADAGMGIWFNWSITVAVPGRSVLVSNVFARSKYFYIATLSFNVICTALIGFKIWIIQRSVAHSANASQLGGSILSIILESAGIYTAVQVVLIVTSATGSSSMFILLNGIPPLVGSVFSYVILRSSSDSARYGRSSESNTGLKNGGESFSHISRPNRFSAKPAAGLGGGSYQERSFNGLGSRQYPTADGVHVHLEQIVHKDIDANTDGSGERDYKHGESFVV